MLAAARAGALVGDNGSFLLGRRFGFGLNRRYGSLDRMNEARLKFIQYLCLRYGTPIVFAGRFITLLRCWEAFLAGANGMAWRRFIPINAIASLVRVGLWGVGACAPGRASEPVLKAVGFAGLAVVCIVAPLGWPYFRRHEPALHEMAERALPGPLRARQRPLDRQARSPRARLPTAG